MTVILSKCYASKSHTYVCYVCTCTHTRTHTHTRTCTHMHTRTHARTCTHMHTHTRARTCTHTRTHTHAHIHTHTQKHINFLYLCCSRVEKLLKGSGTIVLGGDTDKDDLYIAPTIIVDVKNDDVVMEEEVHAISFIFINNFLLHVIYF